MIIKNSSKINFFGNNDIKKFINQKYNIKVNKIETIGWGMMNTNYIIFSRNAKHIFRQNNSKNLKQVQFEIEILRYLEQKNFPSPRIRKMTNNKDTAIFQKKPCWAYKYIEGENFTVVIPAAIKQIGVLLGELHKLLRNFKPSVTKQTRDPEELKKIVKRNKQKMIHSRLISPKELIEFMEVELEKFSFPSRLPVGITHQDVKPDNIIVKNGKIEGIIDFDNAYRGVLLHDITTTIIWTCFNDNKLNFKLATAFLSGYNSQRAMTRLEKKFLLASIRFRLVREAFSGPYDAIYREPERSHQRSQYFMNLYKKLSINEKEFSSMINSI